MFSFSRLSTFTKTCGNVMPSKIYLYSIASEYTSYDNISFLVSLLASGLGGAGGVPGGVGIGTGYGGKVLNFQIFSQCTKTLTLMRQQHYVL